jgi:hypothetical protein
MTAKSLSENMLQFHAKETQFDYPTSGPHNMCFYLEINMPSYRF